MSAFRGKPDETCRCASIRVSSRTVGRSAKAAAGGLVFAAVGALAINVSLDIAPTLHARADEVIE
jgi:hypothetical protein